MKKLGLWFERDRAQIRSETRILHRSNPQSQR
jgi:hypothetical protein